MQATQKAAVLGFVVGTLAGAAVAVGVMRPAVAPVPQASVEQVGETAPVVVAAQDIPEGTQLTFDMVVQRQMPVTFVTNSVVKPDGVTYVMNQPLLVPVHKGDVLLWSQFETQKTASR